MSISDSAHRMSHLFQVRNMERHAHDHTHNMPKSQLPACECVRRQQHVDADVNPAGTVFKCQTFDLLNLTRGGIQACQTLTNTCREIRYRHVKKKKRKKETGIKYQHSIVVSAAEQIEVSCGERRESVPVQVVNRRWRLRGGRGGEREVRRGGGLLLPLHNEWGEKSHICCGGFIHFILLNIGAPELSAFIHKNLSCYTCGDLGFTHSY